jgi:hypothetical protein
MKVALKHQKSNQIKNSCEFSISYKIIHWFYYKVQIEYPERSTDHGQATGRLYHLRLRVECTLICNLESRERSHVALVIGWFEWLGNPPA